MMFDPTLDELIEDLMHQSSIGNEMDNESRIKEAKQRLLDYIERKYHGH